MNRFIFICLLFAPFILAHAQSSDTFEQYQAQKVSSHVWVIHGPLGIPSVQNRGFMNNPAFIIADKGVIVVDPGSTEEVGEMLLQRIRRLTQLPITHVLNTHVHGDHWLANDALKQAYPDISIMADPRMIKKAKAGAGQSWLESMERMTEGLSRGTQIVYPDKAVADGAEFKIHGLNFRIHSVGIGHSDSDIMIELVDDSLLFTGDNVAYQRIIRMDDGSFRDNIAACERAIGLQLKHYVPGHGPTGDVSRVVAMQQYLQIIYQSVVELYAEGLSDFEMKPLIVKKLVAYQDWSGFDQELGKSISLAVLEVERAEFE
ncbi:MAG: MBL fold metallo-hydrolase [Gammaproteobacteria bacterium]|nr:MBL fold metallo-hydrolase [Gammaproteobacteria bacterium]